MKYSIILLFLIFLFPKKGNSQAKLNRVAKVEGKYFCKCYKQLKKKEKKLEKKQRKREKRIEKNYKSGDKLFGGYSLDFDFVTCVEKKRSKKKMNFIKNLSKKSRVKFRKKVKNNIRKRCSKDASKLYQIIFFEK